jgi:hypothetical protein
VCGNCKKKGHTESDCFASRGRKEEEALEWWKKRFGGGKGKEKETKNKAANVAEEKESTDDKNYAFLVDTDDIALVCTSNFYKEALKTGVMSQSIIIYCGTSSHFAPDRGQLINYSQFGQLMAVLCCTRTQQDKNISPNGQMQETHTGYPHKCLLLPAFGIHTHLMHMNDPNWLQGSTRRL